MSNKHSEFTKMSLSMGNLGLLPYQNPRNKGRIKNIKSVSPIYKKEKRV